MKTNLSIDKLTTTATLSQIASAEQQAAQLLASIGLEPSNYKDETLQSVCQRRKWSEEEVLQWIKKNCLSQNQSAGSLAMDNGHRSKNPDFGDRLGPWCTWLVEEKIARTIHLLREIKDAFPRVHQIHGNQYPWLKDMNWHFEQFRESLKMYSAFTEKKLYPLAKKLDSHKGEILDGTVRELERALAIVEDDQKQLRQHMRILRKKSHNFRDPQGACSTLRILNQNFKMLFENLKEQFKIEKEDVFPLIYEKIRQP